MDAGNASDIRITSAQLVELIANSYETREPRFCFILGSGASVESGIPTGNRLEMTWMNCLMGIEDDKETKKKNPADTRRKAENLKNSGLLFTSFSEIEEAWEAVREAVRQGKSCSIPSEYYFDIYNLRFYPDKPGGDKYSGDRYMESVMEGHHPSLGYYPLALLLTKENLHNLVITTNFDTLVEKALNTYGDKEPLVANHEALADYIVRGIQRPIIAKVHRGLFFKPFNKPEDTAKLATQWKGVLMDVFQQYI